MRTILKIILGGFFLTLYIYPSPIVVNASEYEIYNPTTDRENIDGFSKLQSMNPEVRGWISIYDTQIDYPIVQSQDNIKYLDHNAVGDYVVTGSIFMDYRCNPDFTDFNTIIYGHHVPSGVMFGEIKKFTDQDFFDNHKYGSIYYDGKERGLEIFGILEVDAYDTKIYHTVGENEVEDQVYYQYLLSKAKFKRDVAVSANDKIVLLSTCFVDVTNGRHILLAKITDKVQKESDTRVSIIDKAEFPFIRSIYIPRHLLYFLVCILLFLVMSLTMFLFILLRKKQEKERRILENKKM
ncbi:NPQTN specific sortase B [Streptococcus sp. DD10]|uniref:class B sortase n=1 Tax=Streptococcus sp. DD10 TaxID=1777878 RepID=UPI00079AE8DE|nr:class B sortase [Streptococcus sp. DD10]KXT75617.1 NPQTN specific sortase B [Streptococcus sp. DD10]